jgi:hypothetical protein
LRETVSVNGKINMAIARVQAAVQGYYAGTPAAASFPNTPTEGNLLWAYGTGTTAATNASISGWTLAISTQCGAAKWAAIFYKVAGAGESKDVSLAWVSSNPTYVVIEEWGGFTGTPTIDKTANQNYGASATSQTSGTTATTTAASELCIAGFAMGSTFTSPSFSNSFTEEYKGPTGALQFAIASLVASSTWAAETTCTWTTARLCGGLIATFMGGAAPEEHSGSAAVSGNGATVGSGVKAAYSNSGIAIPDIGAYEYQGAFGSVISGNGSLTTAGFGVVGELDPKITSISGGGSLADEGVKSASGTTSISGGGLPSVIESSDAYFTIFWDGWTGDITWTQNEVEITVEDLMTGVI